MAIFQDIELVFNESKYTVKATDVFRLIAKIEDIISVQDLINSKPPMAKIAEAYAQALTYAGAKATGEEIYASFFSGDSSAAAAASNAVTGLLMMMSPPAQLQKHNKSKKPRTKKKAKPKA